MGGMSASADRHLACIDADVAWFQRHPRRHHRVRVSSQAEAQSMACGSVANNLRDVLANSGDSAHHSEEGTFRKAHLCLGMCL